MSMSKKDKERLAKIRDSKRADQISPVRVPLDNLRIACDYAIDFPAESERWAYLRWCPPSWEDILAQRFPHAGARVRAGLNRHRYVVLFPLRSLLPIFRFLRLDFKYYRWVDGKPDQRSMHPPTKE